jgi:hypothetical protein
MTFMWLDSLDGRKAVHRRGLRSGSRASAGQAVLADFDRRSVRYEAFHRRAHRCKSSAAQINLICIRLSRESITGRVDQNGGYTRAGADWG